MKPEPRHLPNDSRAPTAVLKSRTIRGELPKHVHHEVAVLAAAEEAISGRQPLGAFPLRSECQNPDPTITHTLLIDPAQSSNMVGYARSRQDSSFCEITMRPGHFDRVSELADVLSREGSASNVWVRGSASAAASLIGRPDRELIVMARELSPASEIAQSPAGDFQIRCFDREQDTDNWLELNATAFRELPDQGQLSRDDLAGLLEQDWFDPQGFLVAYSPGHPEHPLAGFHWTKVDPATRLKGQISGEVFVLGVSEHHQGSAASQALLWTGLTHLALRGLRHAHLFVESSNPRARAFYRKNGFAQVDVDRLISI